MSDNSIFSIFSGKYFNQNLICFILGYLGVFFAEKSENSECLTRASWVVLIFSMVSLVITLSCYTYEYCVRKREKAKSHKLRFTYTQGKCEEKNCYIKEIISW